uniref:Ankyrin repeat-containing protein n=1 Tax=Heterorhabditis bacteriophora TaxID=37862 RepID=A0A1I7XJJ1_HETBA
MDITIIQELCFNRKPKKENVIRGVATTKPDVNRMMQLGRDATWKRCNLEEMQLGRDATWKSCNFDVQVLRILIQHKSSSS